MANAGRLILTLVLVVWGGSRLTGQPQEDFAELDAKISRQLAENTWNEASKTFIRALWQDYMSAHFNIIVNPLTKGTLGALPDVADPNDYLGDYRKTENEQTPFLRIGKSDAGSFFAEFRGYRVPAVVRNRSLLFTTGNIVYAGIPAMTGKPYGKLRLYVVLRTGGKFYLASPGAPVETWTELSRTDPILEGVPSSAWAVSESVRKAIGQSFTPFKSAFLATYADFWKREFPSYEMSAVTAGLIDQINDEEMLAFLKERGVRLVPEEILTSANLIAYLQHKNLGTPAAYAWLDLTKGNPSFVRAVLDWQTIRKARGFEFTPAYFLLFNAKLTDKRDGEVWADIFKTTFATLAERDSDKKMLMVFGLLSRLPRDLKEMDPPAAERFAFLTQELEQQNISQPYRQMVLAALYQASFFAKRYTEAAQWARDLEPPATGLSLVFTSQVLAKDIDAATVTLSQIEKLIPPVNKHTLDRYHQIIGQLTQMESGVDPNRILLSSRNPASAPDSSSTLAELMQAVKDAERECPGKSQEQMKDAVAKAALAVFVKYEVENLKKDATGSGNSFHRVTIHEETFKVTGNNYRWRLTPIVEQGQIKDIEVQASPICMW